MRIGSAWTKTSEEKKKTYLSVALDDVVLELFPQLKECSISLSYISPEDRKSDKSPAWYINLSKKSSENKKTETAATEAAVKEEAEISEDEIPF